MLPAPIVCREPTDSRSSGLRPQPSRRNGRLRGISGTSGVVLAVKGVKTYVVALENPAEPVFGFGHDEPVVQLRVDSDAVGIGVVREIEGVVAYGGGQRISRGKPPFQPDVGCSSRPIQQVGFDTRMLCMSGTKHSRTYEAQAENNVQDMRFSLHLQA